MRMSWSTGNSYNSHTDLVLGGKNSKEKKVSPGFCEAIKSVIVDMAR